MRRGEIFRLETRPAEAGEEKTTESVLGSWRNGMYTGNLINELMNAVEVAERRIVETQDADLEGLERWYVTAHRDGRPQSNLAGVA
jgi:hypothetical protein